MTLTTGSTVGLKELRMCGFGEWVYCDGQCHVCGNITTTTSTIRTPRMITATSTSTEATP